MSPTVILIPVLRRPHRVAPLVESIEAATPEPHVTLFVCSPDDTAEQKAVADAGAQVLVIDSPPVAGDYARKINAGFEATTAPFVFLGADDLAFRPRWLTAAVRGMDNLDVGVVGTQDLGNPRVLQHQHATHSLVRRSYINQHGTIDELGKVLHEGYEHNFCDNELVETAMARGAWAFADDSIVEHLHPHWGKADTDDVYRKGVEGFAADRLLFKRRRRLWM